MNKKKIYPFHMPGHKRRMSFETNPYQIDITEIGGYDNLHHPEGMIKELETRISALYGARESYVLINGSTCGILAAISAAAGYGETIALARNSHKSAYNAVHLRGLKAVYVYPEYIPCPGINGAVLPDTLRECLRAGEGRYKAVFITSPTYEGVVSDIGALADISHKYGAALIVDEAHGAHFGLHERAPQSAVRLGADVVIQSIHKTLMGMTQTAVLHLGYGDSAKNRESREDNRIDKDKLEYFLRVYQSSSPSYVLMTSVDNCVRRLEEDRGGKGELFEEYYRRLDYFYEKCKSFADIRIFTPERLDSVDKNKIFGFDCGKLVIFSESGALTGQEIYDMLREEYALQLEMSMGGYCIAMTSCMDCDEGFGRLFTALSEIDGKVKSRNNKKICSACTDISGAASAPGQQRSEFYCTVAEALEADKCEEELKEGLVAGDYGYVYPPGIPFIVPGEIVTKEIICDIIKNMEAGYEVRGISVSDGRLYMKGFRQEVLS